MKSIGVLGGGQLSKLLVLKAKALGIKLLVLSPFKHDPAAQKNPFWIKGDPNIQKDLKSFLKLVDIITFESEFISASHIQKTLKLLKGKKPYIAPSLKVLSLIQDRWTQKNLLLKYGINTAAFLKLDEKHLNSQTLLKIWNKWGPFVLKTRTGGYDGYGTFEIKKSSQIKDINLPSHPFIAEQFIPFKRELAILCARNKKKELLFFPLVESFQKNSRCLWIKGPESHKKLNSLKMQIGEFLHGINYQGIIAFELFDTGRELIVNELAPRVHNSGHYSLDALSEDQFTVHLKAVMNFPFTPVKTLAKGFAMFNLLGEGTKKPVLSNTNSKIHLWWYGKTVSKKGRKMGHINATGASAKLVLNRLLKARKFFKV